MWEWAWENSDKLADLATMAASVFTVMAVAFVAVQIVESRATAREATAEQAYLSYLSTCVDRPHLGTWKMFAARSGLDSPETIEDQTNEECEAYVWMLSEMLMTLELALVAARTEKSWLSTVALQVELHEPPIRKVWPTWKSNYKPVLAGAVEAALRALEDTATKKS